MSNENREPERAPLSSPFALISGLVLLVFMGGTCWTAWRTVTWSLAAILVWGVMFAAGLILWSFRPWIRHLIGSPTLSMVGGVSGAIITAVTLVFALNSSIDQDKTVKDQTELMREQLETLKRIEHKMNEKGAK
jgi:hypothetical protein